MNRIEIIRGDITHLSVDAIVNAANSRLIAGGGVDGAIHRAAGPELQIACNQLGRCLTGEAKITPGFNLPAKYVIHTVGPRYRDGISGEADLLSSCYRSSLKLASEQGITTIAFPSISTGIYGYPINEASRIALNEILNFLITNTTIQKVLIVCFSESDYEVYLNGLKEV